MKRTFENEDNRKNLLFEAWNEYSQEILGRPELKFFDEIYEGVGTVSDLSVNRIGFHLEDGRKIRHVQISSLISQHSVRMDQLYMILGRQNEKWWVLEIISMGSCFFEKDARMRLHFTVNPLLVNAEIPPNLHH
jgi:hypothetical protein